MDNIAHTLIGAGLAQAGLAKKYGRGALFALIVSSNLPDLDHISAYLAGNDALAGASRHTLTHSIVGVIILSVLVASILRPRFQNISWRALTGLALLGSALHVIFDLINTYGVVLFYPFSAARFELPWVFVVDPWIWVLFLPVLFGRLFGSRQRPELMWRISLGLVAGYVLFCGVGHSIAVGRLETLQKREQIRSSFSYVFPEALGPHRFRGVLREGDEWKLYLIHLLTEKIELVSTFHTDDSRPEVMALRRTPAGRKLDWFFKAPVWRIANEEGRQVVEVFDLRFRLAVLGWRESKFDFRFELPDRSGPT